MTELVIRFSRAAAPTWGESWKEFTRSWSPLAFKDASMCICRVTHSPFSHVDLLVKENGRDGLLGASNNPYAPVIVGNPSGVAIRPLVYQREAIVCDARIETAPDIAHSFEDYCRAQIGKPFDSGALKLSTFLSPRFNRDWRSDVAWYCAEMMGRASEMSQLIARIMTVKNRLTAGDLLLVWQPLIQNPDDFAGVM